MIGSERGKRAKMRNQLDYVKAGCVDFLAR